MSEVTLSNGKTAVVRELLAKDAFNLADYEKKSDQGRMLLHMATKMPLDELDALKLKDLLKLQQEFVKENPDLEVPKDFQKSST